MLFCSNITIATSGENVVTQKFGDMDLQGGWLPLVRCHSAATTKVPVMTALESGKEVTGDSQDVDLGKNQLLQEHQWELSAWVPLPCQGPPRCARVAYLYLWMILGHVDKCWEAFAEPHGHIAIHVDSKRLKALLEAAHGIKLEGAGIHPEVHAADLRQPQRADGHEACRVVRELGQPAGLSWEAGRKQNPCFLHSFESQ